MEIANTLIERTPGALDRIIAGRKNTWAARVYGCTILLVGYIASDCLLDQHEKCPFLPLLVL